MISFLFILVFVGNHLMLPMSASAYEQILEAQSHGHTIIYLNYCKLDGLPNELLTLSSIKKLYLKQNVLKKLVRNVMSITLGLHRRLKRVEKHRL